MTNVFVMTKHFFGRDKSMLTTTEYLCRDTYLSQQTRVCHDKGFVMTSILLSWQKTFYRDKQ